MSGAGDLLAVQSSQGGGNAFAQSLSRPALDRLDWVEMGIDSGEFASEQAPSLAPGAHVESTETQGSARVPLHRIQGQTSQVALIVGGMHGSEQSGVQLAKMVLGELASGNRPAPYFTVYIVPSLFPENERQGIFDGEVRPELAFDEDWLHDPKKGKRAGRYGLGDIATCAAPMRDGYCADPNRNFPRAGEDWRDGRDDAFHRPMLDGNQLLCRLVDELAPSRILQLHAIANDRSAGVFIDERHDADGNLEVEATRSDAELAIAMARRVAGGTPEDRDRIQGNLRRLGGAEAERREILDGTSPVEPLNPFYKEPKYAGGRAGPIGDSPSRAQEGALGASAGAYFSTAVKGGRPSITTVTVEIGRYHQGAPGTDRAVDIEAHRDAILEVFLGPVATAPPSE